ncbi:MDR family MFS transporter [Kallotenue papyrolyticum]|uniref:MDR family MFS transporter n=1 Tax=Kallotenue papyrolyticum TaxID=1325125 RepID=UPI000492C58F|nr:MDR family MFS transporter [Kallotenue papyrolyticum]
MNDTIALDTPHYSRRDTLLTMISVLLVMLLATLDQTIVGTAMPRIIAELQGYQHYTWVATAYLLSSTVMVPIYGKLSDLFGRKPIFLFGLIVFLLGSWLSGAARSMNQLIAFRALQGLGAAALLPIAIAIVGDLFAPRERARWQGITGAVFGLSAITGPLVGGWLTDHASWRWVFYVNVPLGLVALATLIFLMPTLRPRQREVRIDYQGAALLIVATVPLLLGLSWGGSEYAWRSPVIIGLFVTAALGSLAFVLYEHRLERRGGQPIIEPSLFRNRIFSIAVLITIITNMALFGAIFFLPLFVQGVVGASVTNSGLILTPLMLTAIGASVLSGQIIAARGAYKINAIVGMLISILGAWLLTRLDVHATRAQVTLAMVVMGLGMGVGMSLYTLVVQNALPTRIGQATSALTFFRSIGSTVALAAMGALLNNTYLPAFQNALPAQLAQRLPAEALQVFGNPQVLLSPEIHAQLTQRFAQAGPRGVSMLETLLSAVKTALAQSVHTVFLFSLALMIVGLVVVLFLPEIELRSSRQRRDETISAGEPLALA